MIFFSIPLVIFLLVLGVLGLLLFSPVVVRVDSRSRDVKVEWSPLLAYKISLSAAHERRQLTVVGFSVHLGRKRKTQSRKKEKSKRSRAEAQVRRAP